MKKPTREEVTPRVAWLNQYLRARRREQLARQELDQARDAALHLAPAEAGTRHPTGTHSDKTARAAERLDLARRACSAAALNSRLTFRRVSDAISAVEDVNQREILRRRYLLGETLWQISITMDIEYRWLRRLHQRAVLSALPALPPAQRM